MKTKIKASLSDSGIQVGDEIPAKSASMIRRELAVESPESWEKFYRAWYALTNDKPGFSPNPIIRTA